VFQEMVFPLLQQFSSGEVSSCTKITKDDGIFEVTLIERLKNKVGLVFKNSVSQ
jgi:hypothetical protein